MGEYVYENNTMQLFIPHTRISDVSGFPISECQSNCPQACEIRSYGASLSYASLSSVLDSVVLEIMANYQENYRQALEIYQVRFQTISVFLSVGLFVAGSDVGGSHILNKKKPRTFC